MRPYVLSSVFPTLIILIPLISFGIFIYTHALNVPYNDDEALLYSLNQILDSPSDSFSALFTQQNDHRIFFSRIASLTIKLVSGKMNFRIMIISGYLNLVLLGYAFFLIYKSTQTKLACFIPVAVLLFSPIVYATHLWAITSFEYTLAITFSLYCLIFLQPSKQKIWFWSIPFAMAAALSNLDGLSVIPVGLVWLISQKRKKESLYFCIFAILFLTIFFIEFHFSVASKFPPFPQITGIVLKAFVSYCGAISKVLSDTHGLILSTIAGTCILIVLLGFNIFKFFKKRDWGDVLFPVSLTEISFLELLACGLMIAFGRAADGAATMLAIRFQVYAVSTFILFYLFVLHILRNEKYKRYFFILYLLSALFLNALSYLKYADAVAVHNDELKVDSFNFPNHNSFLYQYTENPDPHKLLYSHYEFPEYFDKRKMDRWYEVLKEGMVSPQIQFSYKNSGHLPEYQRWIHPAIYFKINNLPSSVPDKNVYIALYNLEKPLKTFLVAVRRDNATWFREILPNPADRSFFAIFPKKMPHKFYDIALCWNNNGVDTSILVARSINLGQIRKAPPID